MIERARARAVYDQLQVAEITAFLEDLDRSFDVIVACDAVIYFGDLRQVTVPAARRLKAGGVVAFTVERGNVDPFVLTDSGRFAHHPNHIDEVAAAAGLRVHTKNEAVLRYEYGLEVPGLVVVLTA
jgi:predicted TPR repeat methyltransferase